jgi:hypothetical protein
MNITCRKYEGRELLGKSDRSHGQYSVTIVSGDVSSIRTLQDREQWR